MGFVPRQGPCQGTEGFVLGLFCIVKAQYEDARALVTIVAFLTALAGAVFNRFALTYDLPTLGEITRDWHYVWPMVTYAMFGAYAVIVAVSAFVIFGAMKPRIYEPDRAAPGRRDSFALTFHARLLKTHPRTCGNLDLEQLANLVPYQ
jgi:hypothetical protein